MLYGHWWGLSLPAANLGTLQPSQSLLRPLSGFKSATDRFAVLVRWPRSAGWHPKKGVSRVSEVAVHELHRIFRMSLFFWFIYIYIDIDILFFLYKLFSLSFFCLTSSFTLQVTSNHQTKNMWGFSTNPLRFQLQSLTCRTICTAPDRVLMWAAPTSRMRKCDAPEVYLISCPGWEVLGKRYELQVPKYFS